MSTKKLSEDVTIGGQPSTSDIKQCADQGFKSLINFRVTNEEEGQLDPAEEAKLAEEQGMQYLHIPVSMKSMSPSAVDEFRTKFAELPKPVFAHCKSGKRAGAMVMIDTAYRQGMSGQQTLEKAEEMGFECDNPQLREFVASYVDQHA